MKLERKVARITRAEASIGEANAKLFDQEGARQHYLIKSMK